MIGADKEDLMKAIQVYELGGPEVLRYEDVPLPEPGPGQARVKIAAIGVNYTDVYSRTGLYPVGQFPYIPGSEAAGTIDALGPGVVDFQVGDRVASAGLPHTYAAYAVGPAAALVSIPEGVSLETAAAVMLQGMTAHYLSHSTYPIESGDVVLIHAAAGGVGLLLTQMAKMRGARVIGTVSTEAKAALARQAGVDDVILYAQSDFAAETRRLTDGAGVAVVYDSVGRDTFDKSLDCLRPRGYMVLFGQSSGRVPPFDPQILNAKGSLYLTRPTLGSYVATRNELLARAEALFAWIAAGDLTVRIDRVVPLAQAAEAHRALEARQTSGKILLAP
jgi:NADPH2:quinone reductase